MVSVPDYGELILNSINVKRLSVFSVFKVSVPDYGELILNNIVEGIEFDENSKVSVPDYGELILNTLKKEMSVVSSLICFRPRLRGTNLKHYGKQFHEQ